MSVASKNPFDLLGDDDDDSPSLDSAPVPKATITPKANPPRNVPGAGAQNKPQQGGRYPSRGGGPRNAYRNDRAEERGPRNTGPVPESGNEMGMENAGGFDGERVAPPKRAHHGPDKHTKGPGEHVLTSGGHRARGSGHVRGAKTPAFGAERRQFERRSGGNLDSQKKVDQGWGPDEGGAELTAEVEGEGDAAAEENTPQTPGVVNEDGGWGAPVISATEADANTASAGDGGWGAADTSATGAEAVPVSTTDGGWGAPTTSAPGGAEGDTAFATTAEPEAPAEPEEIQKSYDEFLAERARAALSAGLGKKEGRLVNAETLEGKAFRREAANDVYFAGKEKTVSKVKPKKEKVFIEVDGSFASPAGGRPTRGSGERGGRGGGRGRGGERGGRGGDRGGDRGGRGRGAPRGAGSDFGGRGRGGHGPAPTADDQKAFPALGA